MYKIMINGKKPIENPFSPYLTYTATGIFLTHKPKIGS